MATSQGTYKGVNITPGSDADIAKQMAAIDSGSTGTQNAQLGTQAYSQQLLQQAQQLLNTPKAPAPITPTTTQNPPAPYTAPGYTTPTSTPPDMNTLITQANSTLGYDPNEAKTLQDKEAGILGDIKGILDHQGTQSAREAELQNQLGVPELNKNLTEIQNQIRALNAEAFQQVQNQEGRQAPMFGIVGEQERIQRLNSARQYGLAATAQAMQGSIALAQDSIDRAIKAEFGADEAKLNYQKLLLDLNRDKLSAADQKKTQALQLAWDERNRILEEQKADKEGIYKLMATLGSYGAPASVISSLNNATDYGQALQMAAPYMQSPESKLALEQAKLDLQYKKNQIFLQGLDINAAQSPKTAEVSNGLLGVLGSAKIGQATKTSVGTILGVINAAEDLAKTSGGVFTGFYPGAKIVDYVVPNGLKKSSTIQNEGYLNAINLKVQQWASGATLTEAQTKLVYGMVPTKNDTDAAVRTKLNNLVNFMQQQIKGSLASEGVSYVPDRVDLFTTDTLDSIFSEPNWNALQMK